MMFTSLSPTIDYYLIELANMVLPFIDFNILLMMSCLIAGSIFIFSYIYLYIEIDLESHGFKESRFLSETILLGSYGILMNPINILRTVKKVVRYTKFKTILTRFGFNRRVLITSNFDAIDQIFQNPTITSKLSSHYKIFENWFGSSFYKNDDEKWKKCMEIVFSFIHKNADYHFHILHMNNPAFELVTSFLREKEESLMKNMSICVSDCVLDIMFNIVAGQSLETDTLRFSNRDQEYAACVRKLHSLMKKRMFSFWRKTFLYEFTSDSKVEKECLTYIRNKWSKICESATEHLPISAEEQIPAEHNNSTFETDRFLITAILGSPMGFMMTDEEIGNLMEYFIFNGHETISTAICFTLQMLASHPALQELIYNEQKAIFPSCFRRTTRDELPKMIRLERFINETMRVYPPVPILYRKLEKSIIAGSPIPKGSEIWIHLFSFISNTGPAKFDTDMFLRNSSHPHSFVFGSGKGKCPGEKFAMNIMKCVLSLIVRSFKLRPIYRDEALKVSAGTVLNVDNAVDEETGIRLLLERRCLFKRELALPSATR